jgi:AhpD family alkylhydroperoxidase
MEDKYNKRLYKISEFYRFLQEALRTMKYVRRAKRSKDLDNKLFERIMLAVTEVNGCEVCSYKHTEFALKEGMSQEDINAILSGSTENIPEDESVAIFFAQHYADSKARPSKEAWQRVVDTYAEKKALGILGTIRIIMIGNTLGIAFGAFKNRLKGKKVEKSSLGYELGMLLSIIPFLPIAIIHSIIASIFCRPLIKFDK